MEFGLNFTDHQKEPPALSEQGEEERWLKGRVQKTSPLDLISFGLPNTPGREVLPSDFCS